MKPEIRQAGGLYVFDWVETGITITVSTVRQEKSGAVSGELHITRKGGGVNRHLYQSRLNFVAPRSKVELINVLTKTTDDVLWAQTIEELSFYFLERFRSGEPVVEISSEDDFEPPSYLLYPLLPEGHPTMVFGDPGSGKSLFGLLVVVMTTLPWAENDLGFSTNGRMRQAIYLDWETDEKEIGWRLKALRTGIGIGPIFVNYRRCALSLPDDLSEIQRIVMEKKIELLIVDSLGPACGGDLTSAEPALRMLASLRQLRVTSLILAHEAKAKANKPTAYGSIFFTALARSIWRAELIQEVGESEFVMALRHTKANTSKKHEPMCFRVKFGNDNITIAKENLDKIPELLGTEPLWRQIMVFLEQGGATIEELIKETGSTDGMIRKTLTNMKKRGQVTNIARGTWGLLANVTR